jgi:hypothetical protein
MLFYLSIDLVDSVEQHISSRYVEKSPTVPRFDTVIYVQINLLLSRIYRIKGSVDTLLFVVALG